MIKIIYMNINTNNMKTEYQIKVTTKNKKVFTKNFTTEFDLSDDLSREYDDEIENSLTIMFEEIIQTDGVCDYYDVVIKLPPGT